MVIHILTKVEVLFFILACGAVARYKKVMTDEAIDDLTRVVLDVTLPFLFVYILATKCLGRTILSLWLGPILAMVINLTGYAVGMFAARVLRLPPKRRDTLALVISFQNSGFLAIPIAFALFGEEGVLHVTIFSIGFNILYWTFGVWLINRSSDTHDIHPFKNLLNPVIVALVVGLLLGVFCVKLPGLLLEASRMLGDITVPLAMLVVGGMLAGKGLKRDASFKEISVVILCKLVIVPVIFLIVFKSLKEVSPLMRSIAMLQAALPSASTTPLLAKRFGGDYQLASDAVFFTTLFSVATVPVFMSLI